MSSLQLSYYMDLIKQVNVGNYRGRKIMAKPIFLLAVIESIEKGFVVENKFIYKNLNETYRNIYRSLLGEKVTPMHKPFFYLQHDGFWYLRFITTQTPIKSVKALKNNVEYAYLDHALWDLLQDAEVRLRLKAEIVRFFKLD